MSESGSGRNHGPAGGTSDGPWPVPPAAQPMKKSRSNRWGGGVAENYNSQVTPGLTSSLQCLRDSHLMCSVTFQRHQEVRLLSWRHYVQEIRSLGKTARKRPAAPCTGVSPTEGGSRSETLPWCVPGPPRLPLRSPEEPVSKVR